MSKSLIQQATDNLFNNDTEEEVGMGIEVYQERQARWAELRAQLDKNIEIKKKLEADSLPVKEID
jgi:hypothetical protein